MKKQTRLWTKHNGTKVRICDMDDKHLLNTISMLRRAAVRKREAEIQYMTLCPAPRGDMAQDAFSNDYDQLLESSWEDFVHDLFGPMIEDAIRRGLKPPGF